MKTSTEPARMPDFAVGIVTRHNDCHGLAPRSAAASSRNGSIRSSVEKIGSTMNGR